MVVVGCCIVVVYLVVGDFVWCWLVVGLCVVDFVGVV